MKGSFLICQQWSYQKMIETWSLKKKWEEFISFISSVIISTITRVIISFITNSITTFITSSISTSSHQQKKSVIFLQSGEHLSANQIQCTSKMIQKCCEGIPSVNPIILFQLCLLDSSFDFVGFVFCSSFFSFFQHALTLLCGRHFFPSFLISFYPF